MNVVCLINYGVYHYRELQISMILKTGKDRPLMAVQER